MLEPPSNLLWRPLALELTSYEVRQLSVRYQFASLGTKCPVPSRLVGLGRAVTALATIAMDFTADG